MTSLRTSDGSNLPQLKQARENLRGLAQRSIVCELLKTFSVPMDQMSLNRAIMNETMKLAGGDFACVAYFDPEKPQVRYIQRSNGAFEKKIGRPPFYFTQTAPVLLESGGRAGNGIPEMSGFEAMLLVPVVASSITLGVIEIFYRKAPAEADAAEAMRLAGAAARCAAPAVINSLIREESAGMSRERAGAGRKGPEGGPAAGIGLTRETFTAFIDSILDLAVITCACEYTAALIWDKKTLSYRTIGEKPAKDAIDPGTYDVFTREASAAIDDAATRMQATGLSGGDGVKVNKKRDRRKEGGSGPAAAEPIRGVMAVPALNFTQGRGGLVFINRPPGASGTGFDYDDGMAALLLANYLGAFYESFSSAVELEDRIRSLNVIHSISGISEKFFDRRDFESAIDRALAKVAEFMRVYCAAIAVYDEEDGELRVYNSLHRDISTPLARLISEINLDIWREGKDSPRPRAASEDDMINLSEVAVYGGPLKAFRYDFAKCTGMGADLEVSARPIFFSGKPAGQLFFIRSTTGHEERCRALYRENEAETLEFIGAASAILTSMIVAERNYRTLNRLEKDAARMERLAALGEVAAGVAHEIRNPLGGISLFVSSLAASFQGDDQKKRWISQIVEAIGRINGLISNLLNFSREEVLSKKNADLSQIARDAAASLEREMREKGVGISLPQGEAAAFCDPEKIRQVFANLISNALNAFEGADGEMPGGRPSVMIAAKSDPEKGCAEALVGNDGPPIPPEMAEKIFRPFFTTRSKGTGLGLSISQKIVEAHGGRIRLLAGEEAEKAMPGMAVVFSITIPRNEKS